MQLMAYHFLFVFVPLGVEGGEPEFSCLNINIPDWLLFG